MSNPMPPQGAPQPQPEAKRNWFVRHKIMTGILAAFLLFGFAGALGDDEVEADLTSSAAADESPEVTVEEEPTEEPVPAEEPSEEPAEEEAPEPEPEPEPEPAVEEKPEPKPEPKAKPTPKPEPEMTVAQESAIRSAQSYLDMSGFSRQGLIDQLSSEYGEGFNVKDAEFAVDYLNVNWKAEAVESAESYLEMSGFSRAGLIDQLTSSYGEQFTMAQAVHAVNAVGL